MRQSIVLLFTELGPLNSLSLRKERLRKRFRFFLYMELIWVGLSFLVRNHFLLDCFRLRGAHPASRSAVCSRTGPLGPLPWGLSCKGSEGSSSRRSILHEAAASSILLACLLTCPMPPQVSRDVSRFLISKTRIMRKAAYLSHSVTVKLTLGKE